jgi:radical SAM superfamily enzyme YgiQ (UPF0313 family)
MILPKIKKGNILKVAFVSISLGNYVPLSLGCIKSFVESDDNIKKKTDIRIFNFEEYSFSENYFFGILSSFRPDIICFSCYVWNIERILGLSEKLKQQNNKRVIVLGGPEASASFGKLIRNKSVDIVLKGDGELSMRELLIKIIGNMADYQSVPGILFKKGNKILSNKSDHAISNLDDIPSPYISGSIGISSRTHDFATIEVARGCIFKCAFCFENKSYNKIRYFSVKRVLDEMRFILSRGIHKFWLIHPSLSINKTYLKELSDGIESISKNIKIITFLEMRAETIDDEVMSYLKKMSVSSVTVGLQTIKKETSRNISREFSLEKFDKGIKLLQDSKIPFIIDVIYGLPGDDFFDSVRTFSYALSKKPYRISIFQLSILPGTMLQDNAKKLKIIYDDKPPYKIISSCSFGKKDIEKANVFWKSIERELYCQKDFKYS